jgi:8-oxo-dGTP diphosphatase
LSAPPRVRVVAAALFDAEGRVLLAERPPGKHMAGWWEFPGGKVGPGESDTDALVRELREELGIDARPEREIARVRHDYPDRLVQIVLWQAAVVEGVPRGLDGQRLQWVAPGELAAQRLLEADRPFIEALQLLLSKPSP